MKRSLTRAGLRLNKLKLAGAIQLITCIVCANAVSALGQHFSQVAADAVADFIGGQILPSMPLLASMSSGVNPSSNRHHRQYASDNFSTRPFEAACEVAL